MERSITITCLAQHELEIYCGLKSGLVEVYDQNILLQTMLEGHKKEVFGIDVSKDLVVSISKDMTVFTWSTRTKVQFLIFWWKKIGQDKHLWYNIDIFRLVIAR